ncbi:MAG: hypothetical protein VX113_08860, partial [Pseudomonadota bacterium]|nr:hypothetical protein [Pseudomonadota bacterium]
MLRGARLCHTRYLHGIVIYTGGDTKIARNSVLQSGLEPRFKRHFLGDKYSALVPGGHADSVGCAAPASSNDIRMTNVPNIR